MRCLGIIDWGIGGIDFARKFHKAFPQVQTIYLSDSGFTPYGKLADVDLRRRLAHLVEILAERGASHVVIACNAASTTLSDDKSEAINQAVDTSFGLPCIGVIQPTLAVLRKLPKSQAPVLVLGGKRTIDSGIYQQGLEDAGLACIAKIAQPLSALVERGVTSGAELLATLGEILGDDLPTIATLVPACTHYMAILPALTKITKPSFVIDPAAETLKYLSMHWRPAPIMGADSKNPDIFLTTGSAEAMRLSAMSAFGFSMPSVSILSR